MIIQTIQVVGSTPTSGSILHQFAATPPLPHFALTLLLKVAAFPAAADDDSMRHRPAR
jgi:hypothetical protein